MEKLTEDLAMSQECENRCIFAMMVVMAVNNQINDFLGKMNPEERELCAQIWDSHCSTPVGVLFVRPNFDGHEERNQDFQQ